MADLTQKDIDVLKSRLTEESVLIMKYKTFAHNTNDSIIHDMCQEIAAQHINHFKTLLDHLAV